MSLQSVTDIDTEVEEENVQRRGPHGPAMRLDGTQVMKRHVQMHARRRKRTRHKREFAELNSSEESDEKEAEEDEEDGMRHRTGPTDGQTASTKHSDIISTKTETETKKDSNGWDWDLLEMNNSNIFLLLDDKNRQLLQKIIAKAMVSIPTLTQVQMSNCGVDDFFLQCIVQNILSCDENKTDINISELWMPSNPIGDAGILQLCELVKHFEKLKVVKLQNNRKDISTKVCATLCDALEANHNIVKFEFRFRHFQERDRLDKVLWRNQERLRTLRLERKRSENELLIGRIVTVDFLFVYLFIYVHVCGDFFPIILFCFF
ncbi:hypothetical protein RFI_09467 [Reticulomyxa filosa]|uniref:Uncharacterized protein n=1 Tax=Reticulomyxa filosa TaxID=46433 RepID=X6NN17_RETFI|nr:hypothetical protein RFI_09467 [Reticulomyxa filosa]|eukprot:ETO27665.1 hypothetical protein RFI_09467 [Reticulomyxa filosa]